MADISSILADLDDDQNSSEQKQADLQSLLRAWTNEKLAPTLLPYPSAILTKSQSQIRRKIEELEDSSFALSEAVQNRAAGYGTSTTTGGTGNLARIIQETALNRIRFLVRSLLRTRLEKIAVQTPFLLTLAAEEPFRFEQLLSKQEETFMRARWGIVSRHLQDACLDTLPSQFRGMDDASGSGPDMRGTGLYEELEMKSVIARVLRVDGTTGDEGEGTKMGSLEVHGIDKDEVITLRPGDCWVVRWGDVRARVEAGTIELV